MAQAIAFSNPNFPRLGAHIDSAAARRLAMVEPGCHAGAPGALICGLGPSLQRGPVLAALRRRLAAGWTLFAIKEAISWLGERGLHADYAVNMDPGAQEVARTPVVAGVTYCIASSCHPALFDHVLGNGGKVLVYHSACGWCERKLRPGFVLAVAPDQQAVAFGNFEMQTTEGNAFTPVCSTMKSEVEVYRERFPRADVIVGGFTVANRALGLAKYMGFETVVMAGCDFGWRDDRDGYYARFVAAEPLQDVFMNDHGRVDGRPWRTRPDMLASAIDIARHIKRGEVTVLGDSLAVALAAKDDAYLDRVVRLQHQ